MKEQSENFNKVIENISKAINRNLRAKEDNNWTEKFLEGLNSKPDQTKQRIRDLKDRPLEIIQS